MMFTILVMPLVYCLTALSFWGSGVAIKLTDGKIISGNIHCQTICSKVNWSRHL